MKKLILIILIGMFITNCVMVQSEVIVEQRHDIMRVPQGYTIEDQNNLRKAHPWELETETGKAIKI